MDEKSYTVGEVARMAHVTVRTLHHYDEIGLLEPADRTASGYRKYDEADLQRLHQILLFRELDFPLEAIGRLLDDPGFDRATALRAQREMLTEQVERTEAVIRAVDRAIESIEGGHLMDTSTMFDGFDEFDHAQHEDEARERWGETDPYRESMRRTKSYTREDWARIKADGDEIMQALAEMLAAGRRPDEDEVAALAERHRLHIDRWFYPCDHVMHAGLAEMYVADSRFGEYFEARQEGLAAFVADAIRANADRAG